MKFEVLPPAEDSQGTTFQLIFDVPGTDVMRAAYRERIARLARDTSSEGPDGEFDAKVAAWQEGTALVVTTPNPQRVAGELRAFHDNTRAAVEEILSTPGVPVYENGTVTFIPRRVSLGAQALALANAIGEEHAVHTFAVAMQDDTFNVAAAEPPAA